MSLDQSSAKYTIINVQKALDLLDILAESQEPLTLQMLARRVGFTRNKTFRVLATLVEQGLVERTTVTGEYQLGAIAVRLGKKLFDSSNLPRHTASMLRGPQDAADIVSYARPIIENLARKHDEAVYITVIKDNEVLFLNMVDCLQPIKTEPLIGKKFPFFTNAAGKVIKAVESWDLLERICRRDGRPRPDLVKLASELQEIRVTGVAVDNGGLGEGIISVAVAVRDYAGKVVGAITVLGPSFRMLAERVENEIIPSLQDAAGLLSTRFGYVPG